MSEPAALSLRTLGVIRTPHQDPDRTPIQPCFAEEVLGEVLLDSDLAEGLEGLETFSHAFLLYHLHRAHPGPLKVKPFLATTLKGVFGCRYPHRPNALGLSLVRLVAVKGNRVVFAGADMLDGSPLLDIKPYFPNADRPESAWGGWTEHVERQKARRIGCRLEEPDARLDAQGLFLPPMPLC
jgi:tRNA-Thr(GGU) m(6)t(6)A37 methyltransferase TsaA